MTPSQLLDFERQHPTATPEKHERIRHELGISDIRYYAMLARAAESSEGIAADPFTARVIRDRAYDRARRREERVA
jgi:hypothetical protein